MISERDALTELVAIKDLRDKVDFLRNQQYKKTEADRLEAEFWNREQSAWANARLALRLSKVDWSISG